MSGPDAADCDPNTARKYRGGHLARHVALAPSYYPESVDDALSTSGDDASWPDDHRDVVTVVLDEIDDRVAALWSE